MDVLDELVPKLVELPGVIAVVLGGSRATGTQRPDSDWDIGVYYRGSFDANLLAGLGYAGHVAQPGEWGRIINGGAWLSLQNQSVDVLLRDLDVIEQWWEEVQTGHFEIDNVEGHLAGLPTYVPVGEIAIAHVLEGQLPEVFFPRKLQEVAELRWRWNGAFSLLFAEQYATSGDRTACVGQLARAAMQTAHAVLASRAHWALNEKRLIDRADLAETHDIVAVAATDPPTAVSRMRKLLDPPRLDELAAHLPDQTT